MVTRIKIRLRSWYPSFGN